MSWRKQERATAERRRRRRVLQAAAAALAAGSVCASILACRGVSEAAGVPLLDADHAADVLVEKRALQPPPSDTGNRFVRGWWPLAQNRKTAYRPAGEESALEWVTLDPRARTLTISGHARHASPGDRLIARLTGAGQMGSALELPLRFPLQIPLPDSLPIGRSGIELRFPKSARVMVRRAWLDHARAAGAVELSAAAIRQGPTSAVDLARPVGAGARLLGLFEPPSATGASQRFRLLVEREGRPPQVGFEWRATWWSRLAGRRPISVDLGPEPGLVRIRLLAEGSGRAATWRQLRLVEAGVGPPSPPTRPPPPPRLVVVYVLDALRADAVDLDADGYTPRIARLAAEGVAFERHFSVAPNTIPSTKSLFTGQPFLLGGNRNLPASHPPTLAELFTAAGYRTAAFSGNAYVSPALGTTRGFEYVATETHIHEQADRPGSYNDNVERVQRSALAWLDALPPGARAFLYLHVVDPHNPYDPPKEISARFTAGIESQLEASTRNLISIRQRRLAVSAADRERLRALYRGAVAYADVQVGALVHALERRLPPSEILFVLTADHGEELFDHGGVLHGYTLHRELLGIPLILRWPGRLAPRRITDVTVNLDLHESLRALLGTGPSPAAAGRPFWDLVLGATRRDEPERLRFAAASGVPGGIFSASSRRTKLVFAPRVRRSFGMGEGLGREHDAESRFDLLADPLEDHNLAGHETIEVAWLRSRLRAWIERGLRLERDAGGSSAEATSEIDEETRANLVALGYLERSPRPRSRQLH